MAGLFLMGIPILGGIVGGTTLQIVMRVQEMSLIQRIGVELALIGTGAGAICMKPPGSAARGENWGLFLVCGSMVTTGVFAMAEGLIVNIVSGGTATVLKALGLVIVACLAYCFHKRLERAGRGAEALSSSKYEPA